MLSSLLDCLSVMAMNIKPFLLSLLCFASTVAFAQTLSAPPAAASAAANPDSAPSVDKSSLGTGFFITDGGLLVTAYHVVVNFNEVSVDKVKEYQNKMEEFLSTRKAPILASILAKKAFDEAIEKELGTALDEFKGVTA